MLTETESRSPCNKSTEKQYEVKASFKSPNNLASVLQVYKLKKTLWLSPYYLLVSRHFEIGIKFEYSW